MLQAQVAVAGMTLPQLMKLTCPKWQLHKDDSGRGRDQPDDRGVPQDDGDRESGGDEADRAKQIGQSFCEFPCDRDGIQSGAGQLVGVTRRP
jgi:hypothetical protein